jgi:polyisoprenoid-binding protein YceI
VTAPGPALTVSWHVAAHRTTAGFTVRKLGLIRVRGTFAVRDGFAVTDGCGAPRRAGAVLDAASVATGFARRDTDLRGARFFDVDRFGELTYRADRFEAADGGWLARGTLVVRDREVPLDLTVVLTPSHSTDGDAGGDADGDADGDEVLLTCRGVIDRAATGLRAPRWLIGRWIGVQVQAVLTADPTG